jgi:hypothetical protein
MGDLVSNKRSTERQRGLMSSLFEVTALERKTVSQSQRHETWYVRRRIDIVVVPSGVLDPASPNACCPILCSGTAMCSAFTLMIYQQGAEQEM